VKINWKGLLFWSNQFYGICAVSLAIESSLQLQHVMPSIYALLLIHIATVIYYTHAYLLDRKEGIYNERSSWYLKHKKYIYTRQIIYTLIGIYIALFKCKIFDLLFNSTILFWILIAVTFFFCFFYYLPSILPEKKNILRTSGYLKSISIAWVWATATCIIPIWLMGSFNLIINNFPFWFHFIQLFLFIFVLAVLFDVKDINRDQQDQVNTIALKIGKDEITKRIVLPTLILYAILAIMEAYLMRESILILTTQLLLMVLVYWVSKLIMGIKSIFYNILLIDGLMIIKVILSSIILWM
jgi:4-hydroxybenzoate polyprenyltransferase